MQRCILGVWEVGAGAWWGGRGSRAGPLSARRPNQRGREAVGGLKVVWQACGRVGAGDVAVLQCGRLVVVVCAAVCVAVLTRGPTMN